MQQEDRCLRAFGYDTKVDYRVTGDRLELVNSKNEVTLTFTFIQKPQLPMNPADLVGTKWQLRAVSGEDISADALVTLNRYTAEGDDIWFGEHYNNYARCRDGGELDGIEAKLTVSGVTDYRLSGTELELLTYSGDTFLFTAP